MSDKTIDQDLLNFILIYEQTFLKVMFSKIFYSNKFKKKHYYL